MTAHQSWNNPAVLNDLFLYHLARLQASAGSIVVRLCEGSYGITRREWRLIGLLAEGGPMQPSQLAEQAQLDRTRTSRAITSLAAKQLIQRQSQAGDARRAVLQLSDTGRSLYAQLMPQVQAINLQLMGALPPDELEVLARAFERLQRKASEMNAEMLLPKAPRNRRASGKKGTAG